MKLTSQIHDGHDNFFTPLRILMAVMVIVGHAIVVQTGDTSLEPKIFFHYTPSYTAVNAFFIVSGFLVTKSMLYRENLPAYNAARLLRIFPALLVHVLLLTFVMGLLVTNLPLKEYLLHPDTLSQPIRVLTFFDTEMRLPGTFENNPEQLSSAALWTLRYEVLAYIGTAIAFSVGLLKRRWMIGAQFLGCAIAYVAAVRFGIMDNLPATAQSMLRFGIAYGLGAAIYAYRDKFTISLWSIPVFLALTAVLNNQPEMEVFYNLFLAASVFWLAYAKAPKLQFLQNLSDVSYGVYIYHWAVLQCLIAAIPTITTLPLIIASIAISTLIAWLSWIIIEKPALASKSRLAALFSRPKHGLTAAE